MTYVLNSLQTHFGAHSFVIVVSQQTQRVFHENWYCFDNDAFTLVIRFYVYCLDSKSQEFTLILYILYLTYINKYIATNSWAYSLMRAMRNGQKNVYMAFKGLFTPCDYDCDWSVACDSILMVRQQQKIPINNFIFQGVME